MRVASAVTPDGAVSPADVRIEDGFVVDVQPTSGPVDDVVVVPGFVDLQVNGVDDVDCSQASGDDWARVGTLLASAGVTAWLPTLVSQPLEHYSAPLAAIADAAASRDPRLPVVLGAHLEGPFLGDRPGAHRPEHVVAVDLAWLGSLPDVVRVVTLAPEQADAGLAIDLLTARGVVVSLGHSSADLGAAVAAADRGARMVTHLFNGMGGLHHREPGIAGAALCDDRLAVGLIADGVHVHPALYRTVFRAKPDRVVLVSDSVAWRAMAGVTVLDGAPRLADGTLCGSVLAMDAALRNVVDGGVPFEDAVAAAATTPARVLGDATRGRLAPGARADLVVLGRDDLAVERTLVAGEVVHEA